MPRHVLTWSSRGNGTVLAQHIRFPMVATYYFVSGPSDICQIPQSIASGARDVCVAGNIESPRSNESNPSLSQRWGKAIFRKRVVHVRSLGKLASGCHLKICRSRHPRELLQAELFLQQRTARQINGHQTTMRVPFK